jgi:NAD(P)-dependent dehydrogenase (short-subunit alcohol dehydrogenase family)
MARARGADALRDEADYYPLKRIGTADEVAKAILYLASPEPGFIMGDSLALPADNPCWFDGSSTYRPL